MLRKKYIIFFVILLVTSVFSVILFSNSIKYDSTIENVDDTIDLFDLRVSGPQINITTPENKTYYGPMSGYYPATYGFENDDINSTPEEWSDLSDPSTNATIITSQSGHNKVLKLQDSSGSGWARMYQIFNDGGKQSGTVELFVRKNFDSGASGICIQLLDSTQTAMYIYADASNDGRFVHYNGTENEFSPGLYSDDIWFHIRFDFETGMGGYQGLNPDTFDLYINGVKRLSDNPFWNPTTEVTRLYLFTQNMNTGSWYADAIGYSWDPNYNIGDNLNEGLLLSYYTEFNFDWIGYSLDGQATKTILGNTTFPLPANDGLYTIQVFGNNSIGTIYQSQIKHFSTDFNAPTSMISFTPYRDPDIVIKSTFFTITADDGLGSGVSLIRYKINGLSWNTYPGPFNLSTYEYDVYNITYQAIDGVGHIESENTITVTLIPEPSQPGIPGYQLFVMIGVISIVSAILVRKKYK